MPQRLELKVNGSGIGEVTLRLRSFLGDNETEIPECQRLQGEWINIHPWHPRGVNEMRLLDGVYSSRLPCKVCISPGEGEFGTCSFEGIELPTAFTLAGIDDSLLSTGNTAWTNGWTDLIANCPDIAISSVPDRVPYLGCDDPDVTPCVCSPEFSNGLPTGPWITDASYFSVDRPIYHGIVQQTDDCLSSLKDPPSYCGYTHAEIVALLLDLFDGLLIRISDVEGCSGTYLARRELGFRVGAPGVHCQPCCPRPFIEVTLGCSVQSGTFDLVLHGRFKCWGGAEGFFQYDYSQSAGDPLADPITLTKVTPCAGIVPAIFSASGSQPYTLDVRYWMYVDLPDEITLTAVS